MKDDTISRQAAIDAAECIVEHHSITPYKTMAAAMDHLKRILNGMPSAQPETNCSEIPNNSDTIYRQDAIDALDKEYRCTDRSDDWDGLKTAMLIIENLPSVQSRLNKKRISDLLWNEYRTMSPHLSAEGVVARRHYCKELWKELFGEEEMPVWMTW